MWICVLVLVVLGTSVDCDSNPTNCTPMGKQKNTSIILMNLRREMQSAGIGIYIIFSDDEHGSEYTQPYDKRRDWITGFTGSAGIAIVSLRAAALWTDSRYFTQAEEELDCSNWLLMKDGQTGVPDLGSWLVVEANQTTLPPGSTTVFTTTVLWESMNNALKTIGKQLRPVDDLVGRIWPSNERPKESQAPIVTHAVQYAGETVTQKLNRTTRELKRIGATATVINALDEIAWQFSLRGADIPYNPFFKSYAIIYTDYTNRQPKLFLNRAQLNRDNYPVGVDVLDYSAFWSHLNTTATDPTIFKIWISSRVSQAIFGMIPQGKLPTKLMNSVVQRIKARKNPVERQGMRDCQIRDAVVRMKHIGWIEEQLNNGKAINETQAVDQLLIYQKQQDKFQLPSFSAISASGPSAAIVHYSPKPSTAKFITKDQVYLLDAGSQYLDCTTDITRTHHFGIPKMLEKRAYTRVLQGVLDIADTVFPVGTYGQSIDHLGRMHLYRDGMNFGHGVGHGIGHFLGVHEGPQRIGTRYSPYEEPLADGMFLSDEPGFYKPGDFGIRIENDMEVVKTNKSVYDGEQFLRFNTITYVPYERSLIDVSLLTSAQYDAINQYHANVATILEPLLKGDQAALNALRARTAKLDPRSSTITTKPSNNAFLHLSSPCIVLFMFIFELLS